MEEKPKEINGDSILGLSTTELAGLTVGELTGNETAIKMLIHYYKKLVSDNATLRNDNNTLKTYVDAYDRKKSNGATGAVLLTVSNITIAFGVNMLTAEAGWPGWASLLSGLAVAIAGLYFSFFKDLS